MGDYPQFTWAKHLQAGELPYTVEYTRTNIGPLLLPELRDHARITENSDDHLLIRYANEAHSRLEDETGVCLLSSAVVEYYDVWPWDWQDVVHLHKTPATSVTSITYYDTDDVQQTWAAANYDVDVKNKPARITVAEAATVTSPSIDERPNCVEITYGAGYGNTLSDLPDSAVLAIMQRAMWTYDCGRMTNPMGDPAALERCWQNAIRTLMWRAA